MAHKLWEKNFEVNKEIERFTVGRDRELDLYLAKYDVLGSRAHITMLESIGLLEKDELTPVRYCSMSWCYPTSSLSIAPRLTKQHETAWS